MENMEEHKSKYYLALQYMKNKEAAEDVLQDAYLKAFANLKKLQEPEAFEKWLGVIVANTAKNTLAKKNPILFADLTENEDGKEFTYEVKDENPKNQPEIAEAWTAPKIQSNRSGEDNGDRSRALCDRRSILWRYVVEGA